MKKAAAILAATVLSVLGLSFASLTPVSAASPLLVCERSGAFCFQASPLDSGQPVYQDYAQYARNIYVSFTGNSCPVQPGYDTCFGVYLQFYNGDYVASSNSCGPVVQVKPSNATTGIVWYDNENNSGNYELFQNQHCIGSGSFLYGDNSYADPYELDGGGTSGNFYKMRYINP